MINVPIEDGSSLRHSYLAGEGGYCRAECQGEYDRSVAQVLHGLAVTPEG